MSKKAKATGAVRVLWTSRPALLLERGRDVSMIKWDDTKSDQAVPNDQLDFEMRPAAPPEESEDMDFG